jgi:hypothetical protein
MRRDTWNTNLRRVLPEHLPDHLLAQALTTNSIGAIHSPEDVAIRDAASRSPGIDRDLNPRRHRRRSDAAVLANEVNDAPAAVALLDMCERQRRHLRSSEPTPEKNGEDGAIAQAPNGADVWRVE